MNVEVLQEENPALAAMTRAAEIALQDAYGGGFRRLELIKYRENAVYSAYDSEGTRFALRVHRPGYHSDAQLRSELLWTTALAKAGIAVPKTRGTTAGSLLTKIEIPGGQTFQIDLLEWLAGEPIGSIEDPTARPVEEMRASYLLAGKLAARIHAFNGTFAIAEDFNRHAWDKNGLIGPDPFWGRFRELHELRDHVDVIEAACNKAAAELDALGQGPESYGLIHADFVPENLILVGSELRAIDFDDAGFGWYMFEIATALMFYVGTPVYETVRDALFEGYNSVRPLSEDDRRLLLTFLFLRSTTYLGWVHTRSETETAREMTAMFVEMSRKLADDYLADRHSDY